MVFTAVCLVTSTDFTFLIPTGEQDESVSRTYITQIKDLRLQIEDVESRTIARIRQPVDKDPLKDCSRKTAEQKV